LLVAAVPPVLAARIEAPGQFIISDPVAEDNLSGTASALERVTVRNAGTSTLIISSFALSGTDATQFSLPGGTSGVTLAPGASHQVTVAFSAASTGVKTATLSITSNHQNAVGHVTQVALRGLGTAGFDGTDEPSLQRVFDVHGLAVNAGDDDPATNVIHSSTIQQKAALLGDEVGVQSFVKAGNGPVTLQPLSVFGPTTTNPIVRLGWYASTQAATVQPVFTVTNRNDAGLVEKRKGQTVNVQYTGALSFDPANARFGFYSEWPFFSRRLFSEDALNTFAGAVPHHVRVYAVPGEANAYIIAFEEHVSGFDYQDVVVIARNVKPYVPGTIAFSPAQLSFTVQQGASAPPAAQTALVTVNGGAPNLTLTSNANWLTLPATATPGAAVSFGINVANLPATPGTYYANVTAAASGYTTGTLQVALTVTPQAQTPLISVNRTELILSGVKTGAYSTNITLTNEGTAPLGLTSVGITGPNANLFSYQFVDEGQTPVSGAIEPGQSRIVRVTFTPAGAVGPFSATLNIVSNAANTPSLAVGLYGCPPTAWRA
jgi:hypothetical protein